MAIAFGRIEGLVQTSLPFGCEAYPVVANLQFHSRQVLRSGVVEGPRFDLHHSWGGVAVIACDERVLSVHDEVEQHLPQLEPVSPNGGQFLFQIQLEPMRLLSPVENGGAGSGGIER